MATHGDLLPPNPNHAFSWNDVGKALRGEAGSNDWTLRMFYVCWCLYFCERETELCDCARIIGRSHIGAFGRVSYTCRSLSISIKRGVRRHHVSYCVLTSSWHRLLLRAMGRRSRSHARCIHVFTSWPSNAIRGYGVMFTCCNPEEIIDGLVLNRYEHQRRPYDCPSLDRCTCVRDSSDLKSWYYRHLVSLSLIFIMLFCRF